MNPIQWLDNNLPDMPERTRKVIQFIFLWQEYNFFYNLQYERIGKDSKRALLLANDERAKDVYEQKKATFVERFSQIHSNVKHNNPRKKLFTDIDSQNSVEFHAYGQDSLENFLTVVYKIRCNFMHGDKLRNEDAEVDVDLIGWAYDCLSELLYDINYFNI